MTQVAQTPVDRVIAAFGGVRAASEATGIPEKRFYVWRYPRERGGSEGRVPSGQQGAILAAAQRLRLPLTAADLIDVQGVR